MYLVRADDRVGWAVEAASATGGTAWCAVSVAAEPRASEVSIPGGDAAGLVDEWFVAADLRRLRRAAVAAAGRFGLGSVRVAAVELVVSELVSNAVEHGGGQGRLRMWATDSELFCQVSDGGPGMYTPIGPNLPFPDMPRGRGLWLALTYARSVTVDNPMHGGATVTAVFDRITAADN